MELSFKQEYERVIDNCARTLANIWYHEQYYPEHDISHLKIWYTDVTRSMDSYQKMTIYTKAEALYDIMSISGAYSRALQQGQKLREQKQMELEQYPHEPTKTHWFFKVLAVLFILALPVLLIIGG